jgi:hypothetical protein
MLAVLAGTLPALAYRTAGATWVIVVLPIVLTLVFILPFAILFQVWVAAVRVTPEFSNKQRER